MRKEIRNEQLRIDSGFVNSHDKLVGFLYLLLRDYVPAGDIEEIMKQISKKESSETYEFTNGYIASYAKNIQERLINENN